MAWISLAKVVLFLSSLVLIGIALLKPTSDDSQRLPIFAWGILVSIGFFAVSLMWTTASLDYALQALVKHAKLVSILLIVYLIRNVWEARRALTFFLGGQAFVLVCCWLLAAGAQLPWVAVNSSPHVVFAQSYLDQSIMFACSAAVAWYLGRDLAAPKLLAAGFTVAGICAIVFLLPGRTGLLIALCLIALGLFWMLSLRQRWWSVAALVVALIAGVIAAPAGLTQKLLAGHGQTMGQRSEASFQQSNAWRLHALQLSLQAIGDAPLAGTGVGSWSPTVKQLHGADADEVFGVSEASNPHQEFLLWGVSLGLPGIALLIGIFALLVREAMRFEPGNRRATLSVLSAVFIACSLNSALFDDLLGDYLCIVLGLLIAHGRMHAQRLTAEATA